MIMKDKKYRNSLCASVLFGLLLSLVSCKQRDDYPVFERKEPVVTVPEVIPPDNEIGALVKKIMDKTDIISIFKLDSTTALADGIKRTHVRYVNKLNQAMSMQILEVDLSKTNIGVTALSPFDDYLFTVQTLGDMAKYNEGRAGGKIIAAVNGDVVTSSAPTGSFIFKSRQLKTTTTTATSNTRPFLGVKKNGSVFVGNKPSTSSPMDEYNLNDLASLVSGGTWLLYRGDTVTSATETVQANTAVGLNAGRNYLYAVVVDGGTNAFSVGITYNDLGKIMAAIGSSDAFVTNGGTASVMVERAESEGRSSLLSWKVVNRPIALAGGASANGIGFVLK